jgi:hypothetical protein
MVYYRTRSIADVSVIDPVERALEGPGMPNWTGPDGSSDGKCFARPDEDGPPVMATISSRTATGLPPYFSRDPIPSSSLLSGPGFQGLQ